MFDRKRKSIQVNTIGVVDHGKFRSNPEDYHLENVVGKINCIWFTQDNGKLHPQIIPNLSIWVKEATNCNFSVVLWTNKEYIQKNEVDALIAQGIIVRDHSEYKKSLLYPSFLQFLEKGIAGDKTCFALASDIFRMSILELTPDNEYFIYVDPNDITLSCLQKDLMNIPSKMKNNIWGFSFYAERLHHNIFHLRNDVLIALKNINPPFFNDYLESYKQHVNNTQNCYVTPVDDEQAQDLARKITNQITDKFFKINISGFVSAIFGNYIEYCSVIDSGKLIHSMRRVADGNTWLPTGECLHEQKMFGQFLKHECIGTKPSKAMECLNFDDIDFIQDKIVGTFSEKIASPFLERKSEEALLLDRLVLELRDALVKLKIDFIMQFIDIYIKHFLMPAFKPWSALCAPPEKKLITWPVLDLTKIASRKPLLSLSFWENENELVSRNRNNIPQHQEIYDKQFELVTKIV